MPDGSEGDGPTTPAELQRRRDLLTPLVDHPSRACEHVDTVTDILATELARSQTAADAYVGKDAQSREIRETCVQILATVAEDTPESAASAVPTVAGAVGVVGQESAAVLRQVVEDTATADFVRTVAIELLARASGSAARSAQ